MQSGPPGIADVADDLRLVLGVDQRYRALDAIAQEIVSTVALRPEIVRPLAGLQAALDRAVLRIDDDDVVLSRERHEQALVVRQA